MGTLVIGTTDSKTKWTQTLKRKSSLEEFNNEAATSRFARELLINTYEKGSISLQRRKMRPKEESSFAG